MHDPLSIFADHAASPRGRGEIPDGALLGAAGGSACGDMLTIALTLEGGTIARAVFRAEGCAALTACASVLCEVLPGTDLLDAARIGRDWITDALEGLSPERMHAAALAEDALHRALGAALAAERPAFMLEAVSERVVVGLSGGVDSAVVARLLADAGDEVVGVTLQLWDDPATDGTASCCSPQAVTLARRVAHGMGMAHFTLDQRTAFRSAVVDPYLQSFDDGATPNPCVGCNGHVRFDALDEARRRLGARALATGHYARIEHDADGPLLAEAEDARKDQTYMLAAVDPELLTRIEFPLGGLTKPQVREYARGVELPVAERAESQDLCFLAGVGRDEFLRRHAGKDDEEGPILDRHGNELGRHTGAFRFTVGQRRGLGVAAPEPLYVLDVEPRENAVIVGTAAELATRSVRLIGVRLLRPSTAVDQVKLRYHAQAVGCRVDRELAVGHHRELRLDLAEDVAGAAPGQIACLMRGGAVVGWATIARTPVLRDAKITADELQRDSRDIPVVL